jgi:hypothetical protein
MGMSILFPKRSSDNTQSGRTRALSHEAAASDEQEDGDLGALIRDERGSARLTQARPLRVADCAA